MQTVTKDHKPKAHPSLIVRCLRSLHLADFAFGVKKFLYQFLLVDGVRTTIAGIRYFYFVVICRRLRTFDSKTGDLKSYAVSHNRDCMLKTVGGLSVTRSSLLLYPLSAIRISKADPVLSIGPRTEGEILNLMGLGFHNIRALDLITYSPWVELGDIHAMPYKDNQFAVVIIGWVLTYSKNQRKAALEAIRVVRDGGIIAVGCASATPEERERVQGSNVPPDMRVSHWIPTFQELLDCFEPCVDHLYFAQDILPPPATHGNLVALFSVKKSAGSAL